jgi:hypothetical protein
MGYVLTYDPGNTLNGRLRIIVITPNLDTYASCNILYPAVEPLERFFVTFIDVIEIRADISMRN